MGTSFWCPLMKLFVFGNGLSSMHTAAMPDASYFRTMYATLASSPNPLSQSAMMGISTASYMDWVAIRKSVIERMLASGSP